MLPGHNRNWWYAKNHLLMHPCVDCGETNTALLEFDHREPSQKSFNIFRGVPQYGFAKFKAEIEKCDVRCANCHKLRHFNEST